MRMKREAWLRIICILCTVFAVGETVAVQFIYYDILGNSDLAGNFLASYVALQEHTLIPRGYNHTSTLGFESHVWTMAFLLPFTHSIKAAAIISNLVMLFFFFLSVYFLLRSFAVSKAASWIWSFFLVLPFNSHIVNMHAVSQFYLIQLIGICIIIGLFNHVTKKEGIWKYLICGGVLSFLEALNGSRYVSLIVLPLALLGGMLLLEFVRKKAADRSFDQRGSARMIYLLCVGACAGLGYIIYLVMTKSFSTYAGILGIDIDYSLTNICSRIKEIINVWLTDCWAVDLNSFRTSALSGIECIIFLLLSAQLLILPVKALVQSKSKRTKYFAFYIIASFGVSFFLMAFMATVSVTARYFYFVQYCMLLLLPIFFHDRKEKPGFYDVFLLITIVCFAVLSQFTLMKDMKEALQLKASGGMIEADYRDDINEWLMTNGYQYGYATYWNANIGTVRSDCNVEYCAISIVNDNSIYPWFGGMVRQYYHSADYKGKTFILLTKEENSRMKGGLPCGYVETYSNDLYIVYGYEENPYDFSAQLLQYFPVKKETVILEEKNFFTQGSRKDNNIIIKDSSYGGYLVYGPYISFPENTAYDVEYNFEVYHENNESSGYVAVIANNTEEIARAEIMGTGEVSMTLEDVPMRSEEALIQFCIYLDEGCDALFKDIRITRVR